MLTDGRTDDGFTGILIAHLGAFGSGELKIILVIKFYFFSTFRKITVGGFVNQLIKKILS